MPDKTFNLEILTPRCKVFSRPVSSLVVPEEMGSLGVLAHHAPLIASLGPSRITVRQDGSSRLFQAGGSGFLEVDRNKATVLMDEIAEAAV